MLKAGFVLLTITLAVILFACAANIAGRAFTRVSEEKRFRIRVAITLTVWLLYVGILSIKGVFALPAMPPRIPLLLIVPAFIFFGYFFTGRQFIRIIESTPPSWPIYFQSFRIIVELLILALFTQGMLPKAATFEGYNFDIAIGITAPLVGYLVATKPLSNTVTLVWNIAGLITLAIVVSILLSYAYFPGLHNESESILPKGLGLFPFIFLAGFYMPLAVFMHLFSIVKTRKSMR